MIINPVVQTILHYYRNLTAFTSRNVTTGIFIQYCGHLLGIYVMSNLVPLSLFNNQMTPTS